MTKINEITAFLESLAPLSSQESYDNSGLIVGDDQTEVTGVLVSLDCIEKVVDEAIEIGANLIVSHHPIVFSGLKKLSGKTYIERVLIKAIKNDIAIYAIHTNFDNYRYGVNYEIAQRFKLKNTKVLKPQKGVMSKLICFVPRTHSEKVLNSMHQAGGGVIGDYSDVSFTGQGIGQFTPSSETKPFIGESGVNEKVEEDRIEIVVSNHQLKGVVKAMLASHPYEEVAYDVVALSNVNPYEGSGMIGELESPVSINDFLAQTKETFECGVIRHTELIKKEVRKLRFAEVQEVFC